MSNEIKLVSYQEARGRSKRVLFPLSTRRNSEIIYLLLLLLLLSSAGQLRVGSNFNKEKEMNYLPARRLLSLSGRIHLLNFNFSPNYYHRHHGC